MKELRDEQGDQLRLGIDPRPRARQAAALWNL